MSLPNYLSNIKSSGIYRFVWDKSEIPGVQAETLRLVVGYSDKGPFNTPVYVKDAAEFKSIYGNVSKKLERYGAWFHRMAIQALKKGPILALNLKPFKDETVEGVSFNPQEAFKEITLKVDEIYNTARFWTLEPENFETNENTADKYISIVATDSKEASNTIFMRGYQPKGYDVTFKTWYSSVLNGETLPPYLEGHENDMLSQYFAEIYVFRGEFTKSVATNDKLSKYFKVEGDKITLQPYLTNAFGEKIDTLEALAANDASNFIKSYTGILLPEFLSSTNTVISLDAQFNQDNYLHKMMMHFNQSALYEGTIIADQLDTTGWLADPDEGFMSLEKLDPQVSVVTYTPEKGWTYNTPENEGVAVDMYQFDGLTIESVEGDNYAVLVNKEVGDTGIRKGDRFKYDVTEKDENEKETTSPKISSLVNIEKIENDATKATRDITDEPKGRWATTGDNLRSKVVYQYTPENLDSLFTELDKYIKNMHDLNQAENLILSFKKYEQDVEVPFEWRDEDYVYVSKGAEETFMNKIKPQVMDEINHTIRVAWENSHEVGEELPDPESSDYKAFVNEFIQDSENEKYGLGPVDPKKGNHIDLVTKLVFRKIQNSNPIDQSIDFTAHPVITEKLPKEDNLECHWKYTFDLNAEKLVGQTSLLKCVNNITYTSANMVPTYIKGYEFKSGKPKSTKQIDKLHWQHDILDVLGYKGIRIALTSRVDVDYRYIVDTFESFVEGNCKGRITSIAKEKDNAFALVNFPAMSNFDKCTYTSFRDNNGLFDTKYIPMGGNPQKVMGQVFTLASEEDGASYASYNTCLSMRDVNTGIKFVCPSAALVSNLYMEKYTKYFPYTIIAGPNRAVIHENGLIGPDFNFSREDLDNLEPFGVNCMVMVPGKGTYINSNQTAKQNPVTTLSKINVRELCIFLQDEIEHLLQQYQWDFNTPNLRSTIKDRADVILETAKNNGGVYSYLNVCDESNNTEDVINNEMFVLSTSIEPGIGAGKMVQELTLYRKGGMSSLIKD